MDEALLVDSSELSKMLGVSARTIYSMHTQGEMPPPIRIGKAVRWGRKEIVAWINAGGPKAADWKWREQQSKESN